MPYARNRLSKKTSCKLAHVLYSLKKAAIDKEIELKKMIAMKDADLKIVNADEIAELSSEFDDPLIIEPAEIEIIGEMINAIAGNEDDIDADCYDTDDMEDDIAIDESDNDSDEDFLFSALY
ncbi:hypothetical protein ACFFRR_005875 [Megaselia abdita]